MFGARFKLPADTRLGRLADELQGVTRLLLNMATYLPPAAS
jgi:hypothetical protein